ncbi:hypothetical protein ACQPXB_09535 [Amycolatopsis sp. CA-161197]|uniref:hypothetical protein n=1 Tax=Amycolatopsis sp. CA-161197 TaxID=3239922 RepID=UPI003D92018E
MSDEPPFFALPLHASAKAPRVALAPTTEPRVLDWTGQPIPTLYAASNAAAAVFGTGTTAGGITVTSASTWGWIAETDAPPPHRPGARSRDPARRDSPDVGPGRTDRRAATFWTSSRVAVTDVL